jgi:hypothetical protein
MPSLVLHLFIAFSDKHYENDGIKYFYHHTEFVGELK